MDDSNQNIHLVQWDAMRFAIEQARSIDEVKQIRDKAQALLAYAKQQRESHELQNSIAEIKIRAERRAGELLRETERAVPRGSNQFKEVLPDETHPPTLEDLGISRKQSHQWQKLAELPESQFEAEIEAVHESGVELTSAHMQRIINRTPTAVLATDFREWYTPLIYVEAARQVMGQIDIDPASNEIAQRIIQASHYFTIEDDGLDKDWIGRCWLNPPYGNTCPLFVRRLLEQYDCGNVSEAILLVNSHATETNWFAPLWNYILCFTDHRINFYAPEGTQNGSTHGSVFIYLGNQEKKFYEAFHQFGYIVKQVQW